MQRTFDQLGKLSKEDLLLIAECHGHPDAAMASSVIVGRQGHPGHWFTSREQIEAVRNSDAGKAFIASLLLACASTASAMDSEQTAQAAAVGDGVSTAVALSSGAVETNNLISTSPVGLIGLTVAKVAMPRLMRDAEPETRKKALVMTTSVWGGLTINNLLIAAFHSTPIGLAGGAVMAVWAWNHEADKIDAEQAQALALAKE